LSKRLKTRLQAAGVDKAMRGVEGASDHAPAWVELS
jgi:exodeoxyribonuclease-3